ncbi:MAG: helix-turn-helix domain-containing protein [Tannerellaceae bacterium]|nr:helix-turn-helix domain-containing protein [Tannerellaceae bacterium]
MTTKKNVIKEAILPLIASPIHHGRNIAKLRDLFDWTQKDLAEKLGWRQQKVSELEDMEIIPDEILIEIAKVFGISAEKIKYSNVKETAINIFKDNQIQAGGILCVEGTQNQTFTQGVEHILNLTDKLILKEQEVFNTKLETKDKELELEKRSHSLTQRELEILKKEMALLQKA